MIAAGATELAEWEFAEYVYRERGERETLVAARRAILSRCPSLDIFFKVEHEI